MGTEVIYTDGACSSNGNIHATGGFGIFIAKSQYIDAPLKINKKGIPMKWAPFMGKEEPLPITNNRMEGLAIVSTLAMYVNILTRGCDAKGAVASLNEDDPFDITKPQRATAHKILPAKIEIVTDSQFWINVVQTWMPNWIKKGIVNQKKNPDILHMFIHYLGKIQEHSSIEVVFTHVRSHQKGTRSFHANGNDVADVLATSAVKNSSNNFEVVA